MLDRLSFQRFSSQVPDRTTFWTFRKRLTVAKVGDALFEAITRQLVQRGYMARGGQMVDASLVPVPRQHVTEQERALLVDGGRERCLKVQDWRVHIQRKAKKGKPLSACQERRNTRIA